MGRLYKDLTNIIDYEPDKDEQIKTEKYCKNLRIIADILISAVILLGVAAIFCIYADIKWGFYGYLIFDIVSVLLFKRYQKKYGTRLNTLVNECNINKALTAYMVMAQYYKGKTRKSGPLLSCIASVLFYLGKYEEGKKVLNLIPKYCNTPEGNAYRIALSAMVVARDKDKEAVAQCIKELETLMAQRKTSYMTVSYDIISRYPMIMEAEEKGDYAKAVELLPLDEKDSRLKRVNVNYRLYKVAMIAGMDAEAAKHREYVLENGGDTVYKRELEVSN